MAICVVQSIRLNMRLARSGDDKDDDRTQIVYDRNGVVSGRPQSYIVRSDISLLNTEQSCRLSDTVRNAAVCSELALGQVRDHRQRHESQILHVLPFSFSVFCPVFFFLCFLFLFTFVHFFRLTLPMPCRSWGTHVTDNFYHPTLTYTAFYVFVLAFLFSNLLFTYSLVFFFLACLSGWVWKYYHAL